MQLFLDVRICNYKGEAVRLFSQYDFRNDIIVLSNIMPYKPNSDTSHLTVEQLEKRKEIERNSLIVVDNKLAFDKYDILFDEREHLDFSAQAYFDYKKQNMLYIPDELKGRVNMDNIVQLKKMELNKGSVWELNSQSVQNTHIAMLALCYSARKATLGMTQVNMLQDSKIKSKNAMLPFAL